MAGGEGGGGRVRCLKYLLGIIILFVDDNKKGAETRHFYESLGYLLGSR